MPDRWENKGNKTGLIPSGIDKQLSSLQRKLEGFSEQILLELGKISEEYVSFTLEPQLNQAISELYQLPNSIISEFEQNNVDSKTINVYVDAVNSALEYAYEARTHLHVHIAIDDKEPDADKRLYSSKRRLLECGKELGKAAKHLKGLKK